ncbi:MAG TPA: amidohydrolase family protein, partial [Casimicrobiaceae bacterium]|nr:amidohydrolase family protein [Casimicrobiaceae bacterium]
MKCNAHIVIAAIGVLLSLAGCGSVENQLSAAPADLVLKNGKIITVDNAFSIKQAIAIRNDVITGVGSDDEIARQVGPATKVVDLRGRAVIPGLIDSHLHNAGGGSGVDLSTVRTLGDLLGAVEREAKLAHDGELIVSNPDWHEAQLREKRLPHRKELDQVTPNNPLVLIRGGHEYILNSRALAQWNITRDTKSPAGGEIGRDADGNLNGELVDTAKGLAQLPPPPKLVAEEIAAQMSRLNSVGITGIRIPGAFQLGGDPITPYRFFQQLKADGKLTLRVNYLMRIYDFSSPERVRETIQKW